MVALPLFSHAGDYFAVIWASIGGIASQVSVRNGGACKPAPLNRLAVSGKLSQA